MAKARFSSHFPSCAAATIFVAKRAASATTSLAVCGEDPAELMDMGMLSNGEKRAEEMGGEEESLGLSLNSETNNFSKGRDSENSPHCKQNKAYELSQSRCKESSTFCQASSPPSWSTRLASPFLPKGSSPAVETILCLVNPELYLLLLY